VYIPLGGNRVCFFKWCRNLFLIFLLSGFWHGANWTFIIWGALHGIFVVIEKVFKYDKKPGTLLRMFSTFHLVVFSWIFFRAKDLTTAIYIIKKIFTEFQLNLNIIKKSIIPFTGDQTSLDAGLIMLALLIYFFILEKNFKRNALSPLTMATLIILIFIFGEWGQNTFIYFQF